MMPFIGKAHIAYSPIDRGWGLSKLARLVDVYARRLQTQEHMTSQVATAIEEIMKPRGVAVMIEAEHMCMSVRGRRARLLDDHDPVHGHVPRHPEDQVRFTWCAVAPIAAVRLCRAANNDARRRRIARARQRLRQIDHETGLSLRAVRPNRWKRGGP